MRTVAVLMGVAVAVLPARGAGQSAGNATSGDAADPAGGAGVPAAPSSHGDAPGPPPDVRTSVELPTPATEAPPVGRPAQRYGWKIVLVDLASIAAGLATDRPEVFLGGWVLGAPMVHAFNGNGGRALGSLALHVGLPVTGALLGFALERCGPDEGDWCGVGGAFLGIGLGMIAATSIDAGALARKTPVPYEPAVARLVPQLRVRDGQVSVGVVGLF